MARRRYLNLLDKSLHACIAAMEIYNKPDFRYREEAFSILMLNAWELMLKARIIKENDGNMRSVEIWESVPKKDGSKSKRMRPQRNRAGNTKTIGLQRAASLVAQYERDRRHR